MNNNYKDIIGKHFGLLTVIDINEIKAVCECTCGNKKEYLARRVKAGVYTSCGNCYNGIQYKDYIGKVYGNLKVIDVKGNKAVCECICGNKKEIQIPQLHIYKTCGECYNGQPYSSFIGEKHGNLVCVSIVKEKLSTKLKCKCILCGEETEIVFSAFHNGRITKCKKCYNGIQYKDYIGKVYGNLKVIDVKGNKAVCECICGNKKEIQISQLHIYKTCGECYNGIQYKDYVGKVYGSLKVIDVKGVKAVCECTCGNKKVLDIYRLQGSKTCGECYNGIQYKDYIGKIYGNLKVIDVKGGKVVCECTCGNKKVLDIYRLQGSKTCGECYNGQPYSSFIGEKHGNLVCVSIVKEKLSTKLKCKCILCGEETEIVFSAFHNGRITKCKKCYNGIQYKDYIGKVYGNLKVIDVKGNIAVCECTCGNKKEIGLSALQRSKACGKCYNGIQYKDYVGKKYGNLVIKNIISSKELEEYHQKRRGIIAICYCNNCNKINYKFLSDLVIGKKVLCNFCREGDPILKNRCTYDYKNLNKYIGKVFGFVTIISLKKGKRGGVIASCKCSCGNDCDFRLAYLLDKKRDNFCGYCYHGVPYETFIGKTYGYLTVKDFCKKNNKGRIKFICDCKCGKKNGIYEISNLKSGVTASCGCLRTKMTALKLIPFNKLHIISTSTNNEGGLRYICKCDCGNEIEVLESDLFTGKVTCCENCNF